MTFFDKLCQAQNYRELAYSYGLRGGKLTAAGKYQSEAAYWIRQGYIRKAKALLSGNGSKLSPFN